MQQQNIHLCVLKTSYPFLYKRDRGTSRLADKTERPRIPPLTHTHRFKQKYMPGIQTNAKDKHKKCFINSLQGHPCQL